MTSDEIYTHALLPATVPGDVRRSFASRLLPPLLDYDRRHQSELVRTLGVFLYGAGSWNACAEQLHVHGISPRPSRQGCGCRSWLTLTYSAFSRSESTWNDMGAL
ncbi:hypothetical protein [Nonomuraea sp. B19D2]|uniref:PucR family transcriptional regulator n=1 Tax=Nonomuraea sp. B19D2 TaxID=3159561 RepID=UPI0032DA90CF